MLPFYYGKLHEVGIADLINNHMQLTDYRDIAVLVALVIGLTQVFKGFLPDKFVPLLSLVLGVSLSLVVFGLGVGGILTGVMVGLSASGLYDHKTLITG